MRTQRMVGAVRRESELYSSGNPEQVLAAGQRGLRRGARTRALQRTLRGVRFLEERKEESDESDVCEE